MRGRRWWRRRRRRLRRIFKGLFLEGAPGGGRWERAGAEACWALRNITYNQCVCAFVSLTGL